MSITERLRKDLQTVIEQAEAGNTAEVVRTAQKALRELDGARLLTTTEAAEALGVRSINTVKLWCRTGLLSSVQRGNRVMIPLAEIERVQNDERVRAIRAADKLHDASSDFGVSEGLTDEEMQRLSAARPGRLPWQRSRAR
jgi:Helix-turn-helix domain